VEGLKGIAETIEYILYEVVGLIVPGLCFALGVTYAWDSVAAADLLRIGNNWRWLSLVAAYGLGLALQGLSRPITAVFAGLLRLPWIVSRWAGRLVTTKRFRERLATRFNAFQAFLFHRHRHLYIEVSPDRRVDLDEVAEQRWRARLALPADRRLSVSQVRDLSFSAISTERHRLDRFRAATSLARGVATTIPVCVAILVFRISVGHVPLGNTLGWIAALVVLFAGLMERADMYNRLWNHVLQPQFLAVDTQDREPPKTTEGAEHTGGKASIRNR
jgi:hypothetical protein